MKPLIDRLRAVTLRVTNLERSLAFYAGAWGLEPVAHKEGVVFLRAAGTDHHVLVLKQSDRPALDSVTFGTATRDDLLALYDRLHARGVATEQAPRALPSAGGGWGFAFHDSEDRLFKVVADREDHAQPQASEARPLKLAHVVLNATDGAAASAFFTDALGFQLSDQTSRMNFLRCNADHHAIAFCDMGNTSLNHIAFEMAIWNDLMYGVGRVKRAGHAVQWGIGRHGPGDNVFAYFLDPDGFAVEYTAEVQQIDPATHRIGRAADWDRPPEQMDRWGFTELPSAAMKAAMHGDPQRGAQQ
jgi:catechol-2,3-dioxygenase